MRNRRVWPPLAVTAAQSAALLAAAATAAAAAAAAAAAPAAVAGSPSPAATASSLLCGRRYVKLCCGGVSPPLASVCVGLLYDVVLISTTSYLTWNRTGALFVAYAYAYNIGTIAISACFSAPIAEATSAQESA